MTEAAQGRLGRRLARILTLLPYAIRHPGVSVDELSRKFGVRRRELMDDLSLVFLCGLPGYGPGDLIDVTLEEDRVYVRMADYFSLPLRLTPVEALALYAGGAAIADLPDMKEASALRSALKKLGRALGADDGETDKAGISVSLEPGPATHLRTLRQSLLDHKQVKLEYFSASRGKVTNRTVDPWGLVAALGRWYLVAFDHATNDERMFRADRIKTVERLDEPASVPDSFDPDKYRGAFSGGDGDLLTLEISPAAGRWFQDYYPVTHSEVLEDGWHRVSLQFSGSAWAVTLLLRLGNDVRSVQPQELIYETKQLASSIAGRYRGANA
jgi:proteasome accessory factor C